MIERNVIIFNKHAESIQLLADEDRLKILDAILEYSLHGEDLSLPPHLNCIWIIIKDVMDHSWEKYEKRCRINREIASSRKQAFGKGNSGEKEADSRLSLGDTLEDSSEDTYYKEDSSVKDERAVEGSGVLEEKEPCLHRTTSPVTLPNEAAFERLGIPKGTYGIPKVTYGVPKVIQNNIKTNNIKTNNINSPHPHLKTLNDAMENLRKYFEEEEERTRNPHNESSDNEPDKRNTGN